MSSVAAGTVQQSESASLDLALLKRQRDDRSSRSAGEPGSRILTLKLSPFEADTVSTTASRSSPSIGGGSGSGQVVTWDDTIKAISLNSTAAPESADAPYDTGGTPSTLPTAYIQPYIELLQKHDLFKDVQQFLFDAAGATDKTGLTNDVIANPGKYTPREKLLVYLDLLKAKATFDKFIEERRELGKDINNETEVRWAFQNGLDVLGKDAEVHSLLTEKMFKAFQIMFGGQFLVAPPEGLDGMEQMKWQLEKDEKMQALRGELLDGFQRDIVEGGILKDGLATKEDFSVIFKQYNTALGFYTMVLPTEMVQPKIEAANKTYAEFFKDHVLPNLPDAHEALNGLIEAAAGGNLGDREKLGVGSFIPVVDPRLLQPGGGVFGDLEVDLDGLRAAAERDFYYKEGDGLSHLFDPALEAMAKNQFGDGPEKAKEREQFKADVMARLEPLLEKIASGQIGNRLDLAGNIERLVAGLPHPTGGDAWGYRHAVATALEGLVQAAEFVSKMPAAPDAPAGSSPADGAGLQTHSVNDVMVMIALATGLAGQGIAAGGGDSRFFVGGAGEAAIAKTMFGTENKGWSKTLANLQLDYMDKSFLDSSLSKMSKLVTEQVKKDLPNAEVIAPVGVSSEALEKLLAPSLNALAESQFKDNPEAAAQYRVNIVTIINAIWGLGKPGGNFDTLTNQVRQLVDKTITSTPAGTDGAKYRDAVVQGVTSILQASRAVWNDRTATNMNWDTIGITVLHSMAALSAFAKTLGSALGDMPATLPPLLVGEEFPISAREQLSRFFKNTGVAIGGIAAVAWMPVEYFQLFQAYRDGKSDAGDLAFMTIGTIADTVGAAEGMFGLAELLINSAFVGRGGAQIAMLPLAFSTAFTVASVVSWLAWAGLAAYQVAKEQKAVDKFVGNMNDDLNRLLGFKADIYNF